MPDYLFIYFIQRAGLHREPQQDPETHIRQRDQQHDLPRGRQPPELGSYFPHLFQIVTDRRVLKRERKKRRRKKGEEKSSFELTQKWYRGRSRT